MHVTVIFATRNGERTLPRMLAALKATEPPAGWDVVAVDNASTDASPTILREAAASLPLTVLQEPRQGKNCALNRGLQAAEGDLVVLTDDDVLPAPDWLLRFVEAAARCPEADLFGGRIEPVFDTPPPDWLDRWDVDTGVVFAATADLPAGPCDAAAIYGPCMAVRGSVFAAGHRFAETIGPNGTGIYGMGSETELLTRLEALGHRAAFVPGARVGHIVRPEQLEEVWILGRAYRHGFGFARAHPGFTSGRLPIFGVPARLRLMHARNRMAAAAAAAVLPRSKARFRAQWEWHWSRGVLDSFRRP